MEPRTRKRKRITYLNLRRTYKAAIEKDKRKSWQRFVTAENNCDYNYGIRFRNFAAGKSETVMVTPKSWQDDEGKRSMWERCARGLLDFLVPDVIVAQIAKCWVGSESSMMDDAPPFDKVKIWRVMRNRKILIESKSRSLKPPMP